MNIHSKIGRDFLLSGFFLLAVIAGLLTTNLFRQDIIAYQEGYGVIYPTELVLNSRSKVLSAISFYDEIQNRNAIEKVAINHCYCVREPIRESLVLKEKATAKVSFQPGTSFCYSSLFNILHQNSDEDEAPIFPVAAA
jgi:hypothetical protein